MAHRLLPDLFQQKEGRDVFGSLQREIERVFEDFNRSWPSLSNFPKQGISLKVDVLETDRSIEVKAEIPGVDSKDIDVQLKDNVLTIKGEKNEEKEEKKKDYHVSERAYGSFLRSFSLPADVDENKVDAKFVNGILTINLPKSAEANANTKKISVKTS